MFHFIFLMLLNIWKVSLLLGTNDVVKDYGGKLTDISATHLLLQAIEVTHR